ncbi:hypothetical protein EKO27_g3957 [Xylaria grammica]|uniref:Uncharacterized protein n=1 Tax=Xylaria grammica TaxID=363999 RepID=A0A439D9P2_9PEZI|nr:hypothetical protein EKO27_g3957 [Xylaria grammica]
MQFRFPTFLLGLGAASTAFAQVTELYQEGPFALRVKGQASNSSIDGYLSWYNLEGLPAPTFISYTAGSYPIVDPKYEWYFNYTGFVQYRGNEVGILLANPGANTTTPSPYHGQVINLEYQTNSNVAIALLGSGGYMDIGFDGDEKAFNAGQFDDSTYVPGEDPEYSEDLAYYHWAICWQFSGKYKPTLSWVTSGPAHNPTCELVDLLRVEL